MDKYEQFNAARPMPDPTVDGSRESDCEYPMTTVSQCKPDSAWRDWQRAGRDWRNASWATSPGAMLLAATIFANLPGWPDAGKDARKRAFLEGANNPESID